MVHPVQTIPWKMKGNLHSESGSGPDVVEQVEVAEGGGGVGPEIEQVRGANIFKIGFFSENFLKYIEG